MYLRQLCETFEPRIKVTSEASSAAEALEIIALDPPELIFLDIEMLASIKEIPFEVVFVTALNQYAVFAFRLGAVDYLLKPASPNDLIQAVERAAKNLRKPHDQPHLKALMHG